MGAWLPLRSLPGSVCVWQGRRCGAIALTFDDGPSPEWTPLVVEQLDRLGMHATFFCLGSEVRRHPEIVRDLRARGHQVELHGFAHQPHLLRSPRWVRDDLAEGVAALLAVGVQPRWLRPPHGVVSGGTVVAATKQRLRLALWSVWGREWSDPTVDGVVSRVMRGLHDGAVVLLHDSDSNAPSGSAGRATAALGSITDEVLRRKLRAVTFDDLVGRR